MEEAALRCNFTGGNWAAKVLKIEPDGVETVYDLYEPHTDTWITEGYVSRGCGEQFLLGYENCCLGSVNLAQHLGHDPDGRPIIEWDKLEETIHLAVRFLDDVVEANGYVPAVPQLKEAAHRSRRIGLGIMGLGDLLYHVGVRYGSELGQELAAQVMEFIRYHAMKASIHLAQERGPFPAIEGSIYDPQALRWQPPKPLTPFSHDFGRPPIAWDEVVSALRQHGIRNAAQTTVAPTGTIATVSGCEAYGCEPVFALAYTRHVNDNGKDIELQYTSPLFMQALEKAVSDAAERERIIREVRKTGSCQKVDGVPESLKEVFVVAGDITAEEHVRMQAALQAFVDASISKCVVGETLIFTDKGLRPIADFYRGEAADTFRTLENPLRVAGDDGGTDEATEFYFGGEQETVRLDTDLGLRLEATPNHPVRALGDDGEIVWRRMDELRVGDYLVVPYGYTDAFGGQYEFSKIYGHPYRPDERTSSNRFTWPYKITRDLARLLGYLTADGYLGENWVQLTQADNDVVGDAEEILRRRFSAAPKRRRDSRREHLWALQVNGRDMVRFFRDYLGMKGLAAEKGVPLCVTTSGPLIAREYIRGLTLDGYVSSQGRVVPLTTMSERLAREVQALLLALGIPSRLTGRWVKHEYKDGRTGSTFYELAILPDFRWRFLEEIGFAEERKNEKARQVVPQPGRQRLPAPGAKSPRRAVYAQVKDIVPGRATVYDLHVPESHAFISNGLVSHNTINFPADATPDDVARAFQLAWKLGCKGLTVYVTGSREKVVLETEATKKAKQQPRGVMISTKVRPRPHRLKGSTYRMVTPLGTAYITINTNGDDEPFEVFLNVGKAGSDTAAVSEAIGRLISLVLRIPSPLTATKRLHQVVRQLKGIGGGRPLGFGHGRVQSLPDGIAQVLAEHLGLTEPAPPEGSGVEQLSLFPGGDLCPECGQAALVDTEGCRRCYACGYSEC